MSKSLHLEHFHLCCSAFWPCFQICSWGPYLFWPTPTSSFHPWAAWRCVECSSDTLCLARHCTQSLLLTSPRRQTMMHVQLHSTSLDIRFPIEQNTFLHVNIKYLGSLNNRYFKNIFKVRALWAFENHLKLLFVMQYING